MTSQYNTTKFDPRHKNQLTVAFVVFQMIDVRLVDSDGTPTPSSTPESSDAEDDEDEEGEGMTEVRYVPEDKTKLEDMFTVS